MGVDVADDFYFPRIFEPYGVVAAGVWLPNPLLYFPTARIIAPRNSAFVPPTHITETFIFDYAALPYILPPGELLKNTILEPSKLFRIVAPARKNSNLRIFLIARYRQPYWSHPNIVMIALPFLVPRSEFSIHIGILCTSRKGCPCSRQQLRLTRSRL